MPVSIVCEPVANVSAVLRESLSNGYSSNGRGVSKSAGVGDNYVTDDDGCLQTKLAVTAKRVLLSKIEYEEVTNYSQSVLGALKSKYDLLKAGATGKTINFDYLSLGKCSTKNAENFDGSGNAAHASVSQNCNAGPVVKRQNPNELPYPKRVLYPREDVIIGWKNSVRKWQVGVGMMNVGNTCYLNSTLQALFHVPSLANWLVSDVKHMEECDSTDSCIICAMVKTLEASQCNHSAIRPYLVYTKLKFICKHLVMGRQEDAHEFLRYLVEAMEKAYLVRYRNYKELDQYSKETTPINQILGGYLRSAVRCLACGHISVTFQHFQDLLLDIRKADTIEEALDGYFSRERLEDMGYKCESCKKKVSATKQFSLERAPIVLCIQLKRFSVMGTKLNKQITIKPRIDLTKFVSRKDVGEPLSYKLVAMVTHLGASQHCGHYTAIGLTESGSYYNYDDSYVRPISVQNVCNTNAYIIFYEIDKSTRLTGNGEMSSNSDVVKETCQKENGYKNSEAIFATEINNSSINSQHRMVTHSSPGSMKSTHYINKPSTSNGSLSTKFCLNRQIHNISMKSNATSTVKSMNSENRNNIQMTTEQKTSILAETENSQEREYPSYGLCGLASKKPLSVALDNNKRPSSTSNENIINSLAETKRCKGAEYISPSITLPSMPNLSDGNEQTLTQCIKYSSLPLSPLKSLVPYESETDEESTTTEIKDKTLCLEEPNKKKKDIKSIAKRHIDSPSRSLKNAVVENIIKPEKSTFTNRVDCSFTNDDNPSTDYINESSISCANEHTRDKLQKIENLPQKIDLNKLHETNTSLVNRSKAKHKVDIFREIFNQNKSDIATHDSNNSNISSNVQQPRRENATNNSKLSSAGEIYLENNNNINKPESDGGDLNLSRPPFKRSHSTPPSPPVIKTKTGLWQVTTLQPVTACISPPEKKGVKNTKNPFARKTTDSFNKRQKLNSEGRSEKAVFAGNGYRCNNMNDNPISCLMKQSHRGYGVPVLSWKGEETAISREVETDAQQQRQHDWQHEEDAEIDRGRQKKVKTAKESAFYSDSRVPGYNPFQEHENQRRWKVGGAANRHHGGYIRHQFQRNKFKFQRFNPKFQRITTTSYMRNNHRLNSGYSRRNS